MDIPAIVPQPERQCYSFAQFADLGLLHYINKMLFNPKGLALSIDYADGEEDPVGWSLHGFPESVKVQIDEATDEKYRETLRVLFDYTKKFKRMPLET